MNYWHIQLHPGDEDKLKENDIVSILSEKKVIGMGMKWENKNGDPAPDPEKFKNTMTIGDVVMVRTGINPVALVKVVSNYYEDTNIDDNSDWFPLRRKIELLGLYKNYKEMLPEARIQATGTLTRCSDMKAITNKLILEWYKLTQYNNLMDSIKIPKDIQLKLKENWAKFKGGEDNKRDTINSEFEIIISQWQQYKEKILNDTLTIDDYTNRLGKESVSMPGGYLCNFLERTTRNILGSSKPGTANNFGVKLNDDDTYYIKDEKNKQSNRSEAETYFNANIKTLLKSIVSDTDPLAKIRKVEESSYSAKQILMKIVVLDNIADFLHIYSEESIDALYNDFIDDEAEGTLTKNHHLSIVCKNILEVNQEDKFELILLSQFLWKYANSKAIVDIDNPNVILYGSPGTGKTYSVLNNLDFICLGNNSQYEVLQFHPSFTYEDFIEGIKPKGVSKDGNIRFELVNGVFKQFCIKAKQNPNQSFYFVVDEINRANLSAVFGETLSLLEKNYRHNGKDTKNLIRTQYSTLIEDLIKESPEEYARLAYHIDDCEVKFGVPENVFFIGMMNDVDKSIDAFDLALRRRFKWIRKDCNYDVIREETKFKQKEDFNNIDKYISACKELNEYISNKLGLGKSYEFGHSFFMKISNIAKRKEISQKNMVELFDLHLRPTLKEYLRSIFSESELDDKLQEALKTFKESIN